MLFDDEIGRRYPHIKFSKHWTYSPELHYLLGSCHAMVEMISGMPLQPGYRQRLLHVSLVKGAQATTAIEGNSLTEAEVQRVAAGESLPPSRQYQEHEVRNVIDAMNGLLKQVAVDGLSNLITPDLIRQFHREVGQNLGEHFDAIPGRFRTDARIVGPYRCPQPEHVDELVRRLCDWLSTEFGFSTNRQTFTDTVVQAVVTHVYLEWIHPFGDGNGRTGRLLEFYILLRAGNPDIASHILSNHYNNTRAEYYRQLEQANRNRDLTAFLEYAILGYRDGLKEVLDTISLAQIEVAWRYLVYTKFAERSYLKKTVHKRRRRLALALPPTRTLSADEIMILTPELAREYGALTKRTLARDLDELLRMEIVLEGNGRFQVNLGLLGPYMPRLRVSATPPN